MPANKRKKVITKTKRSPVELPAKLIKDVRSLIEAVRENVARTVNSAQVMLYWDIGHRIREEILRRKRAEYGSEIVVTLSRQLVYEYGQGFSEKNLRRMIQFAEVFKVWGIVQTLSTQLGWSHFIVLITLKDELQRKFYTEMCRIERWSVRELRKKVNSMLYERTALSKKPEKLIEKELTKLQKDDTLTPELVFRDPYFLDFLGLADTYSEKDLESAIIKEIETFLLELGVGFSFVARQKRITVDGEDYYIDLLFYNRLLKRLVAIDLKLGKFQAADKGQMELYLRWLEKYEMQKHEKEPVGLILCAGKSDEHVELLQLSKTGIRVASYMTKLPSKAILEKTLHHAIRKARASLESRIEYKKRPKKK